MQPVVAASTMITPAISCHHGIPGGTVCRATINIGVAVGKNDANVANVLLGCCTMGRSTIIGSTAIRITVMSRVWLSLLLVHAAQTAMKTDPYIMMERTRKRRKVVTRDRGKYSANPYRYAA